MFDAGMENQAGLTFSPDGNTAYWVAWNGKWGSSSAGPRTIFAAQRQGHSWSDPVTMPVSGEYSDDDPFVSPDGQWLYFVSARPNADILSLIHISEPTRHDSGSRKPANA